MVVGEMLQSWLSPTGLFLLLNIVIGTIVITSKGFFKSHHHNNFNYNPRSAIDRLRSVGSLYRYRSGDQQQQEAQQHPFFAALDSMRQEQPSTFADDHQLHRAPSVLERFAGLYRYCSGEFSSAEPTTVHGSSTATTVAADGSGNSQQNNNNKLVRSPSVLERLRSVGLYRYRSGEIPTVEDEHPVKQQQQLVDGKREEKQNQDQSNSPPNLARAPSVLERFKSSLLRYTSGELNLDSAAPPEAFQQNQHDQLDHKYGRSQSEAKMKEKKKPNTPKNKVKKSVSGKSSAELPPVVADDQGVDERADDFINKFRQDLRLQRLDSLLQYKEMLDRGK